MITRRKLLLAARELPKVKVRYSTGVQQLNEELVVALPKWVVVVHDISPGSQHNGRK